MGIDIAFLNTPIGYIRICGDEKGLCEIDFVDEKIKVIPKTNSNKYINECVLQLKEYFAGKRKKFNLKLNITGTDFQKKVWNELINIPYGEIVSYNEIAKKIKNPRASRAVGQAVGNNKFSIVIPCHRVIGNNGKLTGYASGIWRKEWLLKHENALK